MSNINQTGQTNNRIIGQPILDNWKQVVRNISNMPEVKQVNASTLQPGVDTPFSLSFNSIRDDGFVIVATSDRFSQKIDVITPYAEAVVDLLKKQNWLSEANDQNEYGSRRKGEQKPNKMNVKRDRAASKTQPNKDDERDDGKTTLADLLNPSLLEKIREQLPQEEVAVKGAEASTPSQAKTSKRIIQKKGTEENEPSFQELMGESPIDDEATFAELFENSNQDWKKFK